MSRRGVIVGLGAAAAGSAVLGSGQAMAAPPPDPSGPPNSGLAPSESESLVFPATDPALQYMSIHNSDWQPYESTTAFTYVPGGGRQVTAGFPYLNAGIHLPNGSQVKQVAVAFDPNSTSPYVRVTRYQPTPGAYTDLTAQVVVTGTTNVVGVVNLDAVIDNTNFTYEVQCGVPVNCTIRGGRIGYLPPARPFVAITPARVYDSRYNAPLGVLGGGGNRTVSVATAYSPNTNTVVGTDVVPPGASAIAYNLTITGTNGAGFLAISPGSASGYTASSINWSTSGQTLANGGQVGLDSSRQVKVFSEGGSTHFLVDVTGYYL